MTPDIVWTKKAVSSSGSDPDLNSISVQAVRINNTLTLMFNSPNTFDAGEYTCTANVNLTTIGINDSKSESSTVNIQLQSEL